MTDKAENYVDLVLLNAKRRQEPSVAQQRVREDAREQERQDYIALYDWDPQDA